ncbi:MBL fold metallo-hydrolase [Halarchaeum sp. P4]|uniref:MBL fold metallo-hydrolase n=1 Tax=Halarchaeum sp. P4 TaxID=3421639 RepID=UPI003EBF7DB1
MEIEIATIGGYEEVGRNMTAVRAGDDVVIFDMGLNLSEVLLHDDVAVERMHSLDLIDLGAIPDDRAVGDLEGSVRAIVFSHGHLDHVGAVGKLAHRYDAPIVATPFTLELVKDQLAGEERFETDNTLVSMEPGETIPIGARCELEFVHVTHSTVGAVNPVLHTPEGAVVYGLDKRLDHTPVIEDPIDVERFSELGDRGVLAYIEDCTNAGRKGRTPSESVARARLRDVFDSLADTDGALVATTFASHVARVASIVEFAREIGREPILLGRSMQTYATTARHFDYPIPEDVEAHGHRASIERALRRVANEGREDFCLVVTGHQGEPRAMLSRMARNETPFEFDAGDAVVFSARTIPEPTNEGQRHRLETLLRQRGVRLYDDVHVSGHLRDEGHYEMLERLRPENVVPAHQTLSGIASYVTLAESQGYTPGEDVHIPRNGTTIQLAE